MTESRLLRLVALVGVVAVGAFVLVRGEGVAVLALATAASVVVPLGLALALARDAEAVPHALRRTLALVVPFSAAAMALSWRWAVGDRVAIGAAALHALACALAGLVGLTRLWSRRGTRFARQHAMFVGPLA
jgi:hypothetical protein